MSGSFGGDGEQTGLGLPAPGILVNTGSTIAEPNDTLLNATIVAGIEVGSTAGPAATLVFPGDSAITPANPTVGPGVLIDTSVFGQTTPEQSVLVSQGTFANAGTIAADAAAGSVFTINVQPGSANAAGLFTNAGTLSVASGNTMDIAVSYNASVNSTGSVQVAAGGTLAIDAGSIGGTLINDGVVLADAESIPGPFGTLEIAGSLSGSGTLAIGDQGTLRLDQATTQTIAFPTNGTGELILPGPGTYSMPLLNLNTGDMIVIAGETALTSAATVAGNTVTITAGGSTTVLQDVSFAAGANQSFESFFDFNFNPGVQVNAPVDTWVGGSGADLSTAANWDVGVPTGGQVLDFDTGGTLTGTASGLVANFTGPNAWVLNDSTLTLAGQSIGRFSSAGLSASTDVTLSGATLVVGGSATFDNVVTALGGSSVVVHGYDVLEGGPLVSLVLSGANTNWQDDGLYADSGALDITGGASLTTAFAALGASGDFANAQVDGGGQWTSNELDIGTGGDAQVSISSGGTVTFGYRAIVGEIDGSSGRIVVDDAVLRSSAAPSDFWRLSIGGAFPNMGGASPQGSVLVTDGGLLDMNGSGLSIGLAGDGELTVSNGGIVKTGSADSSANDAAELGKSGNGLLVVSGAGSTFLAQGGMYDGRGGTGSVVVEDAGFLNITNDPNGAGDFDIGAGSLTDATAIGGSGAALVTTGGRIFVQSGLAVGGHGVNGMLTVNGGSVEVGSQMSVGSGGTIGTLTLTGIGTVSIGAGGTITVDGAGLGTGIAAVAIGSYSNASGVVNVIGSHALLDVGTHDIRLGTNSGDPTSSGNGSLAASFGGLVRAGTIVVGDTGIGSFSANIGGASATGMDVGAQATGQGNVFLTSRNTGLGLNALTVGDLGLGHVAVTDKANLVVLGTAIIGNAAGADGQIAVTGGARFVTLGLIDGPAGPAS